MIMMMMMKKMKYLEEMKKEYAKLHMVCIGCAIIHLMDMFNN